MSEPAAHDPNPEQTEQMIARVKRMMQIAALTTGVGVGALLLVIGYRVFKSEGSVPAIAVTASLPKDARILTTAVAGDRILITIAVGGSTEIRSFNAKTFEPAGQLRFVNEP